MPGRPANECRIASKRVAACGSKLELASMIEIASGAMSTQLDHAPNQMISLCASRHSYDDAVPRTAGCDGARISEVTTRIVKESL
jgi:hypothetical protein